MLFLIKFILYMKYFLPFETYKFINSNFYRMVSSLHKNASEKNNLFLNFIKINFISMIVVSNIAFYAYFIELSHIFQIVYFRVAESIYLI